MNEPTSPTGRCARCAAETTRVFRPGAPAERRQVSVPEDAATIVQPMLVGADREHCVQLALDTKHRLIAATTVSIGTCEHTFIGPREVFRDALLHGASAVVVAHNHPSADATPSGDDRTITRRLSSAGDLLGIELLDHLVVGDPDWASLARLGAV
jgi:DNA repair protein RadC